MKKKKWIKEKFSSYSLSIQKIEENKWVSIKSKYLKMDQLLTTISLKQNWAIAGKLLI